MIFLKISEFFYDNVGGKYHAQGTICNDPRSLPCTAGGLGPGGKAPGNPENTAFWSTKNR